MKKRRTIFILVFICSCQYSFGQIASTRSYEDTLNEYFEVSGTDPRNPEILNNVTSIMGKNNDSFTESMVRILDLMMEKLLPVYKENLSQETLEKLIEFYKSPLGVELVSANKKIALESVAISNEMMMELMSTFNTKLKKEEKPDDK